MKNRSIILFHFKVKICRFLNLKLNDQDDISHNITFIWFSLTDEKGVSDKTKLCGPVYALTVKTNLVTVTNTVNVRLFVSLCLDNDNFGTGLFTINLTLKKRPSRFFCRRKPGSHSCSRIELSQRRSFC